MTKKGKGGKSKDQRLKESKHSDAVLRMNFLHQAALQMAQSPGCKRVSRFYNQTFKQIAQRNVIRLSSSIKHGICKNCNSSLIPGVTLETKYIGRSP